MKRILAISDIHGELKLFDNLLEKVKYDADEDQLILLGDYIDRGPNSKGVLNRVSELKRNGAIVLRGNHDEMMLNAVDGVPEALERWERNGALITLQSYDSSIENVTLSAGAEFEKHISLIREMDYYYETKDYIFVHAGVRPDTPVQKTDPHTFVWIRELFYEKYSGDKTVIFGHTPTSVIRQEKNHDIYFGGNNIIGIDGAATYGGQLNCLELPDKRTYSVAKNKEDSQFIVKHLS
ncbi:Serine/threonine-protein phosphatase 1 [Jeotgalicoccus aerolatus]|uniref:Serine/threonine protein phosphatase 1 n=1 Tax=Jeotgalicoccus aerolatus TaxID=709510 RepID=A0ABS4HJI9_9STAP|nr:metallophosphoesterase family protein [Jeotgalicoccus aerolatus]MBP1951085.1 serine/threonine protein phosphatase 1 [Jeotgalicoccus aerolatus]GGE00373.1 serine/threonine protein phosphatase [Jeotgalicoccus aerolatus]CAD2078192.1 Serine/threonine-protein phosphatase 1 [Jeotgalicoccus aerolatus]